MMKKILITLMLTRMAISNMHGQSVFPPFVTYKPVYANPPQSGAIQSPNYSVPRYSMPMPQETFSNVAGYYVKDNKLVRVKIRVDEVTFRGTTSLYVVGYYGRNGGDLIRSQGMASRISQFGLDKDFYNDFEWKANIVLGTVYFNY